MLIWALSALVHYLAKRVYVHPASPISTLLYSVQAEPANVQKSLKNKLFTAFSWKCTESALLPYESPALTTELRARTAGSLAEKYDKPTADRQPVAGGRFSSVGRGNLPIDKNTVH